MKVIALYWRDSESEDEWQSDSHFDNHDLPEIITIGILQRETTKYYIVSLNRDMKNKNVSCTIIIPKFAVHDVQQLGEINDKGRFTKTKNRRS